VKTTAPGRAAALLLTLVTAVLTTVAVAAPAQAAAFRYWSYWQGVDGTWVAAQTGPGEYTLVDADVQGWRFGITLESPTQTPDNPPVFDDLCPDLTEAGPVDGQVRVAVVIDSGFAADAPERQVPPPDTVSCVSLPEGSTGNQALAAAGDVTEDAGLICAINNYPRNECGATVPDEDAVAAAAAASAEPPNPAEVTSAATAEPVADGDTKDTDPDAEEGSEPESSSLPGFALGAGVLAVLVGAALWIPRQRRKRSAQQGPSDG